MGVPTPRNAEALGKEILQRLDLLERRLLPDRLQAGGQEVLDWDNAVGAGFYWSDTGAANTPIADRFVGQVRRMGGGSLAGRIVQDVSIPDGGAGSDRSWRRYFDGTAWSAWSMITGS